MATKNIFSPVIQTALTTTEPAYTFHVKLSRVMDKRFRVVLRTLILRDACLLVFLLLLSVFGVGTLLVLSPFLLLLPMRIALLVLFMRRVRTVIVTDMYSAFKFHQSDPVRRYARLTQHKELARWNLWSYAGLFAALVAAVILAVLVATILDTGIVWFLLHTFVILLAAVFIGSTVGYMYTQGIVANVNSTLSTEELRLAYASSRSNALMRSIASRHMQECQTAAARQSYPTAPNQTEKQTADAASPKTLPQRVRMSKRTSKHGRTAYAKRRSGNERGNNGNRRDETQ